MLHPSASQTFAVSLAGAVVRLTTTTREEAVCAERSPDLCCSGFRSFFAQALAPLSERRTRQDNHVHGGSAMLVLSRQVGQEIVIGDNVRIVVVAVRGEQVRLGISA